VKSLDSLKNLVGEEKTGVEIVRKAIEQPFRRLIKNAGMDEGVALAKVMDAVGNMGIDVIDGKVKDLVKAGVIDPVKVTRSALQNAASVAVMVMTTEVLITDAPQNSPPAPQMQGGGMGEY